MLQPTRLNEFPALEATKSQPPLLVSGVVSSDADTNAGIWAEVFL